ncbi:beta-propeller fold lactonase family protein [Embleya sp. NPDC050493]|uniref:beta-propeller fold lactonase family protein n=1 Tax=Embleya sp. NPDC050493 TaxID=3363989 RepID=UPI0037A01BE4
MSSNALLCPPRSRWRRRVAAAAASILTATGMVALTAAPAAAVTPTVIATVPVGAGPNFVAVSPDGSHAYVTNAGGGGGPGGPAGTTVTVVDTATNTATGAITVGSGPQGIAVTPDGSRLYVANGGSGSVSVIDTATNTVTSTVTGFNAPYDVAVTPDGTEVYVSDTTFPNGTVKAISTATNTVTASITLGSPFQRGLAIGPDGAHVYVVSPGDNKLSVVDTATHTAGPTPTLSDQAFAIAVSPNGHTAYVAHSNDNFLTVVDLTTLTITGTITTAGNPVGLAFAPDGAHAYVTLASANTLVVVDTATNTVTDTTTVGDVPVAVALSPDGTLGYVVNNTSQTLSVLRLAAPAPTVTAVTPNSGTTAGGTPVTITGTDLTGATAVTFGGTPATGVSCTATSCTATSPAHAAGTVDVRVTTPGGVSAITTADRYTYIAPNADIAVAVTAQPHLGILVPYLTYTLTVHDNGPGAVTSATITASLPPGATATNVSAGCTTTTGSVTCTYGAIANGADSAKSFRVPLHLLSLGHVSVLGVRTASTPTDPNPANDTSTATCTVVSILLATCP